MPSIEWNIERWTEDLKRFSERRPGDVYGLHWGDPDWSAEQFEQKAAGKRAGPGPLHRVVDEFIRPFVTPHSDVLEIGSGGGRWTRYLTVARAVTCVDINDVFDPILAAICKDTSYRFYRTSGYELNGIAAESVDFVFSFGTFVHIEPEGIDAYLGDIARVLRGGGVAVIQYADKRKALAARNPNFSNMDQARMEQAIPPGLHIRRHETTLLDHSNIVEMQKAEASAEPVGFA